MRERGQTLGSQFLNTISFETSKTTPTRIRPMHGYKAFPNAWFLEGSPHGNFAKSEYGPKSTGAIELRDVCDVQFLFHGIYGHFMKSRKSYEIFTFWRNLVSSNTNMTIRSDLDDLYGAYISNMYTFTCPTIKITRFIETIMKKQQFAWN